MRMWLSQKLSSLLQVVLLFVLNILNRIISGLFVTEMEQIISQ